jgi:hypothetical protein
LGAGFTYDNGRYDHDINNGGDRDDEFGGREHDDRNYDPQPVHNDDVYDQTGPSCAAANRHVVHNNTLMGETESEELREARVMKRQMSIALVTTEQRSHEEIARKASRIDAAQHQIVSKQLSEFVPQSSFGNPGSAPGVNGSVPHTSDARRQPITDPLGYAPGKSASILDASRAARDGTKNNADSVISRGTAQVVQYVDSYPLPRYAQGLSQTLTTHDSNNRDDIHQGNNIVQAELTEFPRQDEGS